MDWFGIAKKQQQKIEWVGIAKKRKKMEWVGIAKKHEKDGKGRTGCFPQVRYYL